MGGGVRKEGFKGGERLKLSFSGFCEIAACVNLGVTLEGLRGVDNAARLLYLVCLMLILIWNSADYFFRSFSCI